MGEGSRSSLLSLVKTSVGIVRPTVCPTYSSKTQNSSGCRMLVAFRPERGAPRGPGFLLGRRCAGLSHWAFALRLIGSGGAGPVCALQEKTGLGGREQAGGGSRRAASGQKLRRD